MDKSIAQALYDFFAGFGIDCYEENNVPEKREGISFPYITYSGAVGCFGGGEAAIDADIFTRDGRGFAECDRLALEVIGAVGMDGIILECEGGHIWLKLGSPVAFNLGDPEDDRIKRKHINLTAEFNVIF